MTVATITTDELFGWVARLRTERQLKVLIDTMIITATSAAIGICLTHGPRKTTSTSSSAPATKLDSRPRPPDFTLMMDWPIMAQPGMPPSTPATILAMPWPRHSLFLSLAVSVKSSTMAAVISDSSSPTTAIATEYGKMMRSVSSVNGTAGRAKLGRWSGKAPMSPTVRTSSPSRAAMIEITTMQTSGDGTARVRRGNR
ncbi:hypothetical protein D3C86_1257650 [compost metagenome]